MSFVAWGSCRALRELGEARSRMEAAEAALSGAGGAGPQVKREAV
jgi:hypothetical protein